MIDTEVKRIVDEAHQKARQILEEKADVLHKSAALLLEKEKITGKEFEELFAG